MELLNSLSKLARKNGRADITQDEGVYLERCDLFSLVFLFV